MSLICIGLKYASSVNISYVFSFCIRLYEIAKNRDALVTLRDQGLFQNTDMPCGE